MSQRNERVIEDGERSIQKVRKTWMEEGCSLLDDSLVGSERDINISTTDTTNNPLSLCIRKRHPACRHYIRCQGHSALEKKYEVAVVIIPRYIEIDGQRSHNQDRTTCTREKGHANLIRSERHKKNLKRKGGMIRREGWTLRNGCGCDCITSFTRPGVDRESGGHKYRPAQQDKSPALR